MVVSQIARMKAREQILTHARLVEMLAYDPETGVFIWRRRSNAKAPAGARAGQFRNDGHRAIGIDGMRFYEHRLAWLYVYGKWPDQHIDHINLDGNDNRLANLREAQGSDNYGNQCLRRDNTTGFKGVVLDRGRWHARICKRGRTHHLGTFKTAEAAAAAYDEAAHEFFREFARSH